MEVFCVYIVHFYPHIAKIIEKYHTSYYLPSYIFACFQPQHSICCDFTCFKHFLFVILQHRFIRHIENNPEKHTSQLAILCRDDKKHTTQPIPVLNHENP